MNINTNIFKIESNKEALSRGKILISEPFLTEEIFERSVVLLVEHNPEGSMGIVMNKALPVMVNELVPEFDTIDDIPLYKGGPLGEDILFYLHTLEDIPGCFEVGNGLYLNGNFNTIKEYILTGNNFKDQIRFFLGYSGWDFEQLVREVEENTWIISKSSIGMLNHDNSDNLWRESLEKMGGKYRIWSRFPQYPFLN
ncbi:MAG: YqgE/AlgH family protein [Bacteroides sp.]|nr:YqgE/AlgH family protein [Bacteroides sp.]